MLQVLRWINFPSPQGQPLMNFRPPATLTTGVSPLQVRLTDSSDVRMQPYLESLPSYTNGAPPWTPTNRGHGITSRPLKHDPENLTQRFPRNFALTRTKHSYSIKRIQHAHPRIDTYTSHIVPHNSPLSYSLPNHTNSLFSNLGYGTPTHIIIMPHWYQLFHISCRTHTKLIISIP